MGDARKSGPASRIQMLCGGQWRDSSTDRFSPVHNPSTGQVIAQTPLCTADEVAAVVEAAAEAQGDWAHTPVVERARVMFEYRQILQREFENLSRWVTREHGKTIGESRAEVQRGVEMVEFACGMPSLMMGRTISDIARNVDSETLRHPLGVCAGITPFNFPVMVPLWMVPVAITCGNAFVLKPSEKVPHSAVLLGELLIEAGLPAGIFSIVHGDKAAVDALLEHPKVASISFVGSTNVARYVYEQGTANGKRVQAAGGAKNHMIIMPDADLDQAVSAVETAAYGCAGERCMAGSVAVPVGPGGGAFVEAMAQKAKSLSVGETDGRDDTQMGPLISGEHRDRVAGYLDVAAEQGAAVALDGRQIDYDGGGFVIGPSIVDRVEPGMAVFEDEIFGPLLSVVHADTLEDALAIGRQCPYGNGASIFTRDGHAARQFKQHFNAGMIGINIGVPAPMAWFPFTGWNRSFFGDLHIQGMEGVQFYTRQKVTMTRWFASAGQSADDPVWRKGS